MHFLTVLPHLRRIKESAILRYNNVINLITQRFANDESEWDDDSNIFSLLPKKIKKRKTNSTTKTENDDGKIKFNVFKINIYFTFTLFYNHCLFVDCMIIDCDFSNVRHNIVEKKPFPIFHRNEYKPFSKGFNHI